jgi:uncharacterized membrane protein YgdD (TMEM256/DUF423 family)
MKVILLLQNSFNPFYMHKGFLRAGAFFAMLAVALGAFGAHGLKKVADADAVAIFDTGVRYQVYHSIALILTGILMASFQGRRLLWAGRFFIAGIILFSGSLYLLTFFRASGIVGLSGLGIVTPIGGLGFLAGWIMMLLSFTNSSDKLKS